MNNPDPTGLSTERLLLRQWKAADLPIFAQLNADPEVMRYFPHTLSRSESDEMAECCERLIEQRGWGFWAIELKSSGAFIGFTGLHQPTAPLPFNPCVEIGWRLHRSHWGQGYATEAARASLNYAFGPLQLEEVVAFTAVLNRPSRSVMERLGMRNTEANFIHPNVPIEHRLSEHVLYKISKLSG